MSYIGLLLQTGLTMTIHRNVYASKNEFGEQVTTEEIIATGIPVRKQTLRQEDLMESQIPTDMASIKWLLFTPLIWDSVPVNIRATDKLTFNRQPTTVTYYQVIRPANATEEEHHYECIIKEIYQD